MAFIVWFFLAAGRQAWTLRRTATDPFARAYASACLAGVVGMCVSGALGDWFLPFVYNIGLGGFRTSVLGWVFLGGLVAVQHLFTPQAADTPANADAGSAPVLAETRF
jgi:hypothetical protein